jgi:N-acetylmuramoyl-L-alanine amidase
MSACYKSYVQNHHIILIFFLLIFSFSATAEANPKKMGFHLEKKIVVIDPGHGGNEKGGQGPDGSFEKTVTLKFAQVLAEELGKTYKTILTRTDDYWVDISTRSATANHVDADMFISIHTGGSLLHQAGGMSLYYYRKTSKSTLMLDPDSSKEFRNDNTEVSWSNIQNRHQQKSKILAESVRDRIGKHTQYKPDIQGAPLVVLEGADMPAILIEIGYITNPVDEKSLHDIDVLSKIAKEIKNGIDDFFEKLQ